PERPDGQDLRLPPPGHVGEATQDVGRGRPVRGPSDVLEEVGVRDKLGLDAPPMNLELAGQTRALRVGGGAQPAERNRLGDRPTEPGRDREDHHDPAGEETSALHERFSASPMLMCSWSAPPWAGRTSQVLSWNRGARPGSRASADMKFAISTSGAPPGTTDVVASIESTRSRALGTPGAVPAGGGWG